MFKILDRQLSKFYTKVSETSGHSMWKVANLACWVFLLAWLVGILPLVGSIGGPKWLCRFVYDGEYQTLSGFEVYGRWVISREYANIYFLGGIMSVIGMKFVMKAQQLTEVLARGLRYQGSTNGLLHVSIWK